MAKITILHKGKVIRKVGLSKTVIIGREVGDIIIKSPTVSARHTRIEKINNRYIAHDLGSTNGTFVNDEKIKSKELRSGDRLRIGHYKFDFENLEEEEEALDSFEDTQDIGGMTIVMGDSEFISTPKKQAPSPPEKGESQKPQVATIILKQRGETPKITHIGSKPVLIGSGAICDIRIKGLTIGDVAASIENKGDQYEISHKRGLAKLSIEGENKKQHTLKNGDKFSIGGFSFEFTLAP